LERGNDFLWGIRTRRMGRLPLADKGDGIALPTGRRITSGIAVRRTRAIDRPLWIWLTLPCGSNWPACGIGRIGWRTVRNISVDRIALIRVIRIRRILVKPSHDYTPSTRRAPRDR